MRPIVSEYRSTLDREGYDTIHTDLTYEGISQSYRTGRLEREL